MSGYSLATAPNALKQFISKLRDEIVSSFPQIEAIIVHGSLAMGSFYVPKSDVDVLVVVKNLDGKERQALYGLFQRHHAKRPYIGGLEVSVIRSIDARHPVSPMPYLVHFSETTKSPMPEANESLSADPDLIAHAVVARERGISIYGSSPRDVLGTPNWNAYLASIQADTDWILDGENILQSPFYGVLNLCRNAMLKATNEQAIVSKEEGALWALTHLPAALCPMVNEALEAYRSETPVHSIEERRLAGRNWDRAMLVHFRDAMRELLKAEPAS